MLEQQQQKPIKVIKLKAKQSKSQIESQTPQSAARQTSAVRPSVPSVKLLTAYQSFINQNHPSFKTLPPPSPLHKQTQNRSQSKANQSRNSRKLPDDASQEYFAKTMDAASLKKIILANQAKVVKDNRQQSASALSQQKHFSKQESPQREPRHASAIKSRTSSKTPNKNHELFSTPPINLMNRTQSSTDVQNRLHLQSSPVRNYNSQTFQRSQSKKEPEQQIFQKLKKPKAGKISTVKPPLSKTNQIQKKIKESQLKLIMQTDQTDKKATEQSDSATKQSVITGRKIDLITRCKHLELQLRHRKKRQYQQTQKLSKLLFFLHCLQRDRGVPINKLYEEDCFKQLPTNRFHQIVRTLDTSFQPFESSSDNEYSFYSEDSYELIDKKLEFAASETKKLNIQKLVPKLDLSLLPAYLSSDEEDNQAQAVNEESGGGPEQYHNDQGGDNFKANGNYNQAAQMSDYDDDLSRAEESLADFQMRNKQHEVHFDPKSHAYVQQQVQKFQSQSSSSNGMNKQKSKESETQSIPEERSEIRVATKHSMSQNTVKNGGAIHEGTPIEMLKGGTMTTDSLAFSLGSSYMLSLANTGNAQKLTEMTRAML